LGIAILTLASCSTLGGSNKSAENTKVAEEKKLTVPDTKQPGSEDTAKGRPDPTVRDQLTVAFSSGPLELDPRKSYSADEAQIFTALYEGLFSYNPLTLAPMPAVASKWKLSEDKKTWTFTIRDTARYWNGDPVVAGDFKASWLSLLEVQRKSPYSSLFDIIVGAKDFRMGLEKDPQKVGIEAPDDHTLVVKLVSPAAYFPSMLCHHSFGPMHPSMIGQNNWSDRPPISNGPFYVVERQKDRLVLAKNELYWDAERVNFKKITILFAENAKAAASMWDSGEARWVAGDVDLDSLRDKSGIVVNPMFATYYFYIKSSTVPWNDKRVREALSISLPWDEIRKGYYLPAASLIFPIPGYPKIEGLTKTDVDRARQLLSDAGYARGINLPELVIRITPSQEAARIANLMALAWKEKLGISVKIDTVSYESYYESLKGNDYVVGSTTWIGDFADPYTFLQMWQRDSNLNDAGYNDPEYEGLIQKSMAQEGEERLKTLSDAEKILLDGGPVLPISYTPALNLIDENEIDGWYPNAMDIHPFKYLVYAAYRPLPGVAQAPIHGTTVTWVR
jgi:peptide/nickel transport system substrate-binding protein/oligopeptide transport system substrate-binding protein